MNPINVKKTQLCSVTGALTSGFVTAHHPIFLSFHLCYFLLCPSGRLSREWIVAMNLVNPGVMPCRIIRLCSNSITTQETN